MNVADDTYRQLLDRLHQHGAAARSMPAPQPGDDGLIRLARRIAEHLGAADLLPAVVDQDLLVQLRDAHNQGRRPDRLDFDAVARELGTLGVASVIRHTGDGCAALYAGPQAPWPDAYGERPFAAVLCPGSFAGPGDTGAYGLTHELGFGPTDDDDGVHGVADAATPAEVAAGIAELVRTVTARRDRSDEVLQQAARAFWAAVADGYPEVETGEFGPDEAVSLELAMRAALHLWLLYNRPAQGIAAARLDAGDIVAARTAAAVDRLLPIAAQLDSPVLADLVYQTAHADAERLAAARDFTHIGDGTATEYLHDRADDLIIAARQAGLPATVELLVDLIGARRAEKEMADARGERIPDGDVPGGVSEGRDGTDVDREERRRG